MWILNLYSYISSEMRRFRQKKVLKDCAFQRKKPDSAQTGEKIVHFQRKKPNPAQTEVKILHYEEEKSGFAQFQRKKF